MMRFKDTQEFKNLERYVNELENAFMKFEDIYGALNAKGNILPTQMLQIIDVLQTIISDCKQEQWTETKTKDEVLFYLTGLNSVLHDIYQTVIKAYGHANIVKNQEDVSDYIGKYESQTQSLRFSCDNLIDKISALKVGPTVQKSSGMAARLAFFEQQAEQQPRHDLHTFSRQPIAVRSGNN